MATLSPETVSTVRPEDAAAIRTIVEHLTAAWNVNDAKTLCEVYADDASIILPGAILKGLPDIESWMAGAFEGKWKGTHVLGHPIELRYIRDDVILLVSHGGAYHPGDSEVPEKFAIRGIWLFVKNNGKWLIHGYGNTPVFDTIPLPAALAG
jgi:uncharacterized protein (TIGR02246 family)